MSQDAELYRLLFEHSTQGLFLLRDGRIKLANQSFAEMVGYVLDELLGGPLDRILAPVYPQDYGVMLARIQSLLAGKSVPRYSEFRFVRRDGELRWCTATISLISYEGEAAVLGALLDITERKRAEEALQESLAREKYLGDILRNASLAIAVGYPDGHVGIVNAAFQELTGYSEEELKTISWNLGLTPPEWRDHEAAQLSELDRSRKAVRYEKEYIRKDGSRVPVELVVHFHLDADGNVSYFAFVSDISERKRSEVAQREYEATVRALLNAPTELVFIVSVDGIILTLNEAAARRIGKPSAELIGASIWDILPPEEAEFRVNQLAEAAASGRSFSYERQRGEAWLESTLFPIWDASGNVTRFVAFAHDITERKQAEEALRANKQLLDSIIDSVPLGVAMTDNEGRFVRVNDEYCRILGFKREELLDRPFSIVFPSVPEDLVWASYQRILSGEMDIAQERTYQRRDGTSIYVDTTNSLVHDQAGAPLVVTVVRDVTALKQSEQQRIALALEQERMRILTDFIAQASHEFRTPLSVINASTYMLKKSPEAGVQQRHLAAIEVQAQSITTLVEALITMLRLDSSQTILTQQVELCNVVEEVYQRKQGDLEAKHLQIGLEFRVRPVIVLGDAEYLSQAITCILDNALRFTPEGGTIQLRVEVVGQNAIVEVTDSGSGIGQADLEHIFERFFRADKARTTRGLGLGLPIAQAIVERHQGRIEVESALGRGSQFRIILPLPE